MHLIYGDKSLYLNVCRSWHVFKYVFWTLNNNRWKNFHTFEVFLWERCFRMEQNKWIFVLCFFITPVSFVERSERRKKLNFFYNYIKDIVFILIWSFLNRIAINICIIIYFSHLKLYSMSISWHEYFSEPLHKCLNVIRPK